MKPLQYIISTNGLGIAVGIIGDKQLAEQDAVLAENLWESNHNDNLFARLLHLNSVEQFKKLMILKEYFAVWDEHWTKNDVSGRRDPALVIQFTKRAIRRARLVMESQVKYENFMQMISARNTEYALGGNTDWNEVGE